MPAGTLCRAFPFKSADNSVLSLNTLLFYHKTQKNSNLTAKTRGKPNIMNSEHLTQLTLPSAVKLPPTGVLTARDIARAARSVLEIERATMPRWDMMNAVVELLNQRYPGGWEMSAGITMGSALRAFPREGLRWDRRRDTVSLSLQKGGDKR